MRCRVATLNVWWRFGAWETREPAILEELLALDADVLCLQEVWLRPDGGSGRAVDPLDVPDGDPDRHQVERIAPAVGLPHHRTAWRYQHDGWAFGNAILSRWPISEQHVLALPDGQAPSEHRSALLLVLDTPAGALPVVTTHTNFQWDQSAVRVEQLAAVAALVAEHRRELPTVLAGDLNAEIDSDELRQLTGKARVAVPGLVFFDAWRTAGNPEEPTWSRANTHAARGVTEADRRIDHVLVTPPLPDGRGRVVAAERFGLAPTAAGEHPSDHFGVMVDLDLAARMADDGPGLGPEHGQYRRHTGGVR